MRTQPIDLYSAAGALKALRMPEHQSWESIIAIAEIHFRERFPQLSAYLRVQNVTGMEFLFGEEADRLTAELPGRMVVPHRPITANEAEELAARIVLLRETAMVAKALVFPLSHAVHPDHVVVPIRRAA
ncbi:MAG: hypothetical protein ACEQSB_02320 [Undibacterium sp.]